jgi:hypothetical protein
MRYAVGRLVRVVVVLLGVAVAVLLLAPQLVWAAPSPTPSPDPTGDLVGVIERARNWLVGIAFTIAAFFATWGAMRRMAAGDDPGEIEKSKAAFRNAFLGAGLAVLAPVLTAIVMGILGVD